MYVSDNRTLRKRARLALKGNWQTALLITFGAGIFGLIISALQINAWFPIMSGMSPYDWIMAFERQMYQYQGITTILAILSFLFSPALAIGLNYYYLQLHRGQEARFSLLFSRMQILWKCLGQLLLTTLLKILWGLTGFVPLFLLLWWTGPFPPLIGMLLTWASMIPFIIASLRYAMAPYLLADSPDIGIIASIARSKELMYGDKGRLFGLCLSFLGWILLALAAMFAMSLLSVIAGIVVGLFISLMVQVYMNSAVAAFYLELTGQAPRPEEAQKGQAE